jgi:hypothetical protein
MVRPIYATRILQNGKREPDRIDKCNSPECRYNENLGCLKNRVTVIWSVEIQSYVCNEYYKMEKTSW